MGLPLQKSFCSKFLRHGSELLLLFFFNYDVVSSSIYTERNSMITIRVKIKGSAGITWRKLGKPRYQDTRDILTALLS
jgi:hypothetical protein